MPPARPRFAAAHVRAAAHLPNIRSDVFYRTYLGSAVLTKVLTSRQLRAARALAGLDQAALAKAARLSLPTIQRMEASDGVIRGNVESLMKLIAALDRAGIQLINEGAVSETGGRGVRLRVPTPRGKR